MATVTQTHATETDGGLVPYKVTIGRYKSMIAAGIFPKGARVELLAGIVATKDVRPSTTWVDGVPAYRFSIRQYLKMMDAGILTEETKVELLGGVLAAIMTKYAPHNWTVGQLGDLLRSLVGREWLVREEKSVVFGRDWRPEPDIFVARGPNDRYRLNDPTANDLALVAEVSVSSYPGDRGVKWHGYAAAKIPVYWVVNLNKRRIEVYSNPVGRGKTARYRDAVHYAEGDSVPVVLDGRELGIIAAADFLP